VSIHDVCCRSIKSVSFKDNIRLRICLRYVAAQTVVYQLLPKVPTMIKIQVLDTPIREMKGIAKVSGKAYHLRIQTAYAFTVSPDGVIAEIPDKFEIALDEDQRPYPRGFYTLQPSSIYIGREFGRMEMSPRLAPVAAGKA